MYHSGHNVLALTAPNSLVGASFLLSCWAEERWHLRALRLKGRGQQNSGQHEWLCQFLRVCTTAFDAQFNEIPPEKLGPWVCDLRLDNMLRARGLAPM